MGRHKFRGTAGKVSMRFQDEDLEIIDRAAAEKGMDRSAFTRWALQTACRRVLGEPVQFVTGVYVPLGERTSA